VPFVATRDVDQDIQTHDTWAGSGPHGGHAPVRASIVPLNGSPGPASLGRWHVRVEAARQRGGSSRCSSPRCRGRGVEHSADPPRAGPPPHRLGSSAYGRGESTEEAVGDHPAGRSVHDGHVVSRQAHSLRPEVALRRARARLTSATVKDPCRFALLAHRRICGWLHRGGGIRREGVGSIAGYTDNSQQQRPAGQLRHDIPLERAAKENFTRKLSS